MTAAASTAPTSPSARALKAARAADWSQAKSILTELIQNVFALEVESLDVSQDRYSLNSVNGFVRIQGGREYFFKFHHEEGEEVTLQEFYRGELLQKAGFPVDVPEFVSKTIGSQMLMYRRRTSPRVADLCERLDRAPLADARALLDAQASLDTLTHSIYSRTLHVAPAEWVAREPIHQLFHHRLIKAGQPQSIGGRARQFFWDRTFDVAGTVLAAAELRAAHWVVNGIPYHDTLDELLSRSHTLLEPKRLAEFGAVAAHGDAHNANVWWDQQPSGASLIFFDPAFAGDHISTLLAEVKATFHNIFAHPLWLYDAAAATHRYRASAHYDGTVLHVDTDWALTPLRAEFLQLKADRLWRPLLTQLNDRGLLPENWRATLRCALFCCPTLVMDLCAGGTGGHTPVSSAIGLGVAVSMGSEPGARRDDRVSRFLDSIDPTSRPGS